MKKENKKSTTFRFRAAFKRALKLAAAAEGVSQDTILEWAFFKYQEDVRKMSAEQRAAHERELEIYLEEIKRDKRLQADHQLRP